MEIRNRFYALVIILNVELFVRAMKVVVVKAKAHKHDLYAEFFFKQRADWNTSATSYWDWRFPKCGFDSFRRGLIAFAVDWCHIWFTAMMQFCFHCNRFWCDILEISK